MKNVEQKIEKLLEEVAIPKKINSSDNLDQIAKLYSKQFQRKYTVKDIKKFIDDKTQSIYIIGNPVQAVMRIRYKDPRQDQYLSKITKKPRIIFMSDLLSTGSGYGKILIDFAKNKAKKEKIPFLTSAWKKELVPYYEKHGFKEYDVGNNRLHVMMLEN